MNYNITYRQKDGGWQYIISFKEDGKWRQRSKQGFRTKALAKRAADERLEKLKEDFKIELTEGYDEITFKQFIKMFLSSMELHRSYNTVENYETAFNRFDSLDDMVMEKIRFAHIQDCIDDMVRAGLSPKTIKQYVAILKILFNAASDVAGRYRIIRDNPANGRFMLPAIEENNKIRALNRNELDYILDNIKPEKDYMICLLASYCGLRIGEIIGLYQSDIDFEKCELSVNRQWKKTRKNKYGIGKVKSKKRVVPIPRSIIPTLKNYLDNNKVKSIDRRIFPEKNTASVCNRIRYKTKKLGFDSSIHCFRHTYAVALALNGVDYKTIAEYMGNTVEVVINNYSHFIKDMEKAGAQKINQIF
ncbi:MAG TPA: tyrosine-type recombinase/integrase [Clostridia bacterium]|nr:tyrosine-type recombinase/integrase [Clostridia bacterium]